MLKKSLSILLIALMVISCISVGDVRADANQFSYVASAPQNSLYTDIYLPAKGTLANAVVRAFIGKDGKPQYRMYGSINNVAGFYPLNVESDMQGNINLSISSAQAKNDSIQDLGMAKPFDPKNPISPSLSDAAFRIKGYTSLNQQSVYFIENIFGEKEISVLATYDGNNYVLVPAMRFEDFQKLGYLADPIFSNMTKDSYVPVPGALPYNIDDQTARSKVANGNKTVQKPFEFKDGFSYIVDVQDASGKLLQNVRTVANRLNISALLNPVKPVATPKPAAKVKPTAKPKISTNKPKATKKPYRPSNNNNNNNNGYSSSVKKYQRKLMSLGFFDSVVDGIYGPITKKSVKAFQKANGLKQTGKFDTATRRVLNGSTAVNSKGWRVSPIINIPNSSKSAIASVSNVYTTVQIPRNVFATGSYVLASTANGRNPSKVNVDLIVDIINLDTASQVASIRKTAMDVKCGVTINTPGNYRARVFASRGKGLVLKDYKDFKVLANMDGQIPPNDITENEKKNDTYLSVNFKAEPVRLGETVNFTVKLENIIANHAYNITVIPQGISPMSLKNVQNSAYTFSSNFTPTKAGSIPVAVTIDTPSGQKFRSYTVSVYPNITQAEKDDATLDANIIIPGGKVLKNATTELVVNLVNPVFDNDYTYSIVCDKPGINPAINGVKKVSDYRFKFTPESAGDHKLTITVVNKYNHTKVIEKIVKVEESSAVLTPFEIVRTDNGNAYMNRPSSAKFEIKGGAVNVAYSMKAYLKDNNNVYATGDKAVVFNFTPSADPVTVVVETFENGSAVPSESKEFAISVLPLENININVSSDVSAKTITVSTDTEPKKFDIVIKNTTKNVKLLDLKGVNFNTPYVYTFNPAQFAQGNNDIEVMLSDATHESRANTTVAIPMTMTLVSIPKLDLAMNTVADKTEYIAGDTAKLNVTISNIGLDVQSITVKTSSDTDSALNMEKTASVDDSSEITVSLELPLNNEGLQNLQISVLADSGASAGASMQLNVQPLITEPVTEPEAVVEPVAEEIAPESKPVVITIPDGASLADEDGIIRRLPLPKEESEEASAQSDFPTGENAFEENDSENAAAVEQRAENRVAMPQMQEVPQQIEEAVPSESQISEEAEISETQAAPQQSESEYTPDEPSAVEAINDTVPTESPLEIVSQEKPAPKQEKAQEKISYKNDTFSIKTSIKREKPYRGKKHKGKFYIGETIKLKTEVVNALLPDEEYRIDVLVNGSVVKSTVGLSSSVTLKPEKEGKYTVEIRVYNHTVENEENFKSTKLKYDVTEIEKAKDKVEKETSEKEVPQNPVADPQTSAVTPAPTEAPTEIPTEAPDIMDGLMEQTQP